MANITRNFIKGRMNKSVDERLIPDGEYVDAINVRMGSTEGSEIGVIENTKGNIALTALQYKGVPLSASAKCIGAFEDGANETIYWFIHDEDYPVSSDAPLGKIDLIVSYNVLTDQITYHVISVNIDDVTTTLNFDPKYLITAVDKVGDLLFFTDNLNPPRFINVKRNYPDPKVITIIIPKAFDYGNQPFILKEQLQVIKKPPVFSPSLQLRKTGSEENYLEERYICFGYRYRYADNDYSATSPFTEPAFDPLPFNFSTNSFLNEGMINKFNSVRVTVNTGGPLVKGIDLLFKNAQDSTIRVIEKIDKDIKGLGDNNDYTFTFDNSNIFTILPSSEILRLYDNVPRFALGQTMMGNRLIYGNYIDGYNLERNFTPTKIEYTVDLISTANPSTDAVVTKSSTEYFTPSPGPIIPNSRVDFDFSAVDPKDLIKNSSITFDFTIDHAAVQDVNLPSGTTINGVTPATDLSFIFILPKDYNNIYELATSAEFENAIGTLIPPNILDPIPTNPALCEGITFTDDFNCAIPLSLNTSANSAKKYQSYQGGGNVSLSKNTPIEIFASTTSAIIGFRTNMMRFVLDVANPYTGGSFFEFYQIVAAGATFQLDGNAKSLHSNRNYEIGMIYMDEFGRSSTGLVSENNTVYAPCSSSILKNRIQATIPITQIAPEWATHYKFIIKPDEENYEVIYSNIYYIGDSDGMVYFLLEGENSRKVEEGDRLVVKADGLGAALDCTYVTVLEKGAYATDDITSGNVPGAYMKINPNSIDISQDPNAVIDIRKTNQSKDAGVCAGLTFPFTIPGSSPAVAYDVPAGSTVLVEINFSRDGGAFSCKPLSYDLQATMRATRDYANMYDFFEGENFQAVLNTGIGSPTVWLGLSPFPGDGCTVFENYIRWDAGFDVINVRGTPACGGSSSGRRSNLAVRFKVNRADDVVIFETEPQDALPNVWFESADTYEINQFGYHQGSGNNFQNPPLGIPAVVNTDFYNCFSFGNGAEGYKIRDSVVGRTFNLGNRILTTSENEYKEADRYADLTYSGVYNEENNVNKLNEFNLGLLNFKPLEQSFGPIQKLFGRETDILTLQEDKISYVLQGKDLLSDAGAGSALTAVPEVLGTQIARIEEYGISNNPESFVQWGADKYFTDAKRGAVIQLKGSSAQNEQLKVISEQGMRSWFRDLFIDSFETQKLGGFDPYMDEYVLTSNDILKPSDTECKPCGTAITLKTTEILPVNYCVNVGDFVGDIVIEYEIIDQSVSLPGITVNANYNGVDYSTGSVTVGGTLTLPKQSVSEQIVNVTILANDFATAEVLVNCPDAEEITILNVCVTGDDESGLFIHNEYRWTDGSFVSPLHSNSVEFASGANNPLISQYQEVSGRQGGGVIPSDTASVQIISNKTGSDDFVFDETRDNFRYLRTNTLYNNTDTEMQALLAAALPATPIETTPVASGTPIRYYAEFNMPATGSYLYLIWDYRTITEIDLCVGATISDACCGC